MADVTDVDERHDDEQDDDTDPGRRWFVWRAAGRDVAPTRLTPKHKARRVKEQRVNEERAPREGSRLGFVAGLLVVVLIGSNVALWIRLEDKGDDASRTTRVAAAQQQLADQLDTLQTSVEDLKGSVSTLQESVAGVNTAPLGEQIAALQARTDTLTVCVNTYMDALAQWTRNIAAAFVYARC